MKRQAVVSQIYNQCSVLHTIERILDLPATSHLVAQSPLMTACFTEKSDPTPYQTRPAARRRVQGRAMDRSGDVDDVAITEPTFDDWKQNLTPC